MAITKRELPANTMIAKLILEKVYVAFNERLQTFKDEMHFANNMQPFIYMYISSEDPDFYHVHVPEPVEEVKELIRARASEFEPVILEKKKVASYILGLFNYWGKEAHYILGHILPLDVANSLGIERYNLNPHLEEILRQAKARPHFSLMNERLFLEGLLA